MLNWNFCYLSYRVFYFSCVDNSKRRIMNRKPVCVISVQNSTGVLMLSCINRIFLGHLIFLKIDNQMMFCYYNKSIDWLRKICDSFLLIRAI